MKRFVVAAALTLAFPGYGWTADLPPSGPAPRAPSTYVPTTAPIYDWTGFYIGGNGGYGWGTVDTPDNSTPDSSFDIKGGFGGGQVGFNFQSAAWVVGLEADFQGGSIKGSDSPMIGGTKYDTTGQIDWFGTVRGRFGYAIDRVLPYVTGGFAYDHTKTDLTVQAGPSSSASDINMGWTIGGGVEAALSRNWTAKIEYLYMNFGKSGTDFTFTGGPTIHSDAATQVNLVRGGVNYKF